MEGALPVRLLFTGVCLLVALLSLPLILGKVKPNPLYGFRTRLTLSTPRIWYPANAFAGKSLLLAALAGIAGLWLAPARIFSQPGPVVALVLTPMAIALLASLIFLRRFKP